MTASRSQRLVTEQSLEDGPAADILAVQITDPTSELGSGLSASYAAQLTTVTKTANYTAGPQEFVEADATSGVVIITGPSAGTAKRWGVKKTNGTSLLPGNKVLVSYRNSAGVNTTLELALAAESKIFRPAGSGYRVESGDTPNSSLAATYAARPVTVEDLPATGLIYAHKAGSSRNGRPVAPEEARESYRYITDLGQAHIIDGDVRLTRDGVLVLSHDDDTNDPGSVGGVSLTSTLISATAYKDLPQIDLHRLVGSGWSTESYLTMERMLVEFGGRVVIDLEPKDGTAGVVPMAALIKRYRLQRSVIINTGSLVTAQAITDAGCLAHVWLLGSPVTTAWLDQAQATGAYMVEVPIDAPSSLVTYALARFPRVIMGLSSTAGTATSVSSFDVIEAQDARLSGYCHDAAGYIGRPGGRTQRSTNSISGAIRSGKRGPGWLPVNSGNLTDWLTPGNLYLRKNDAGAVSRGMVILFGGLSGLPYPAGVTAGQPSAKQTITAKFIFDTLPTTTSQYAACKVYSPTEAPANPSSDTVEGYKLGLQASGGSFLNSIAVGGGSASAVFNTLPGIPLVAGTEYTVTLETDDSTAGTQKIRLTRQDAIVTLNGAQSAATVTSLTINPSAVSIPTGTSILLPDGTTVVTRATTAVSATSLLITSIAVPAMSSGVALRATSGWVNETIGGKPIWRGYYHSAYSTLTDGVLRITDLAVS